MILIALILAKFILQYALVDPVYELHRDEFLHLDQAHHPAWGYISVPPVTSFISFIILQLGNGIFWIKFFPALFGVLTLWVIWKTIEALEGNLFALILGSTGILFSCLLRLNMLYQPNSLDVLCWTTCYYILIQYLHTEKKRWLFGAAIVFAVGFLNKYNIVFLIIGIVPALLLSKQYKIFTEKQLYLAMIVGLALISPNVLWQYNNDFPIISHMKELAETQLINVDRGDFIKDQLLYFLGALPCILAGLYALWFYKPFAKYKFFFATLFFTLAVFIFFRAKSYYAIGLYPVYIAFGAVYLSKILDKGWKRYLRPVAVTFPVLFFIPMYEVAFPNRAPEEIIKNPEAYKKLGMLRWEDGKDHQLPQDYADMLGWKELALKTDTAYTKLDPQKTLVLCDNYGQAGAINYYSQKGIRAVSFSADYIDWIDLKKTYNNLIRIKDYQESEDELAETAPYFETSTVVGSITNQYSREYKTTIYVFTGAKIDINNRIQQEINEEKKNR